MTQCQIKRDGNVYIDQMIEKNTYKKTESEEGKECPPARSPGEHKQPEVMVRHLNSVFQSLVLLANLSTEFYQAVDKKVLSLQVRLPRGLRKRKTLFLDLDETLIHTSLKNEKGLLKQRIQFRDATVYFNVRPYAFQFIRALSKHYQIVIFSASCTPYAVQFYSYLNAHTGQSLSFCLTRDHCIQIAPGYYLKDLRIVSNRHSKNMVLVDNSTYSFGVNLENGVPVHNFTTDRQDCELRYLQRYLEEMAAVEDVREFNRERLGLREMLGCCGLPVGVAFGQRQEVTQVKIQEEFFRQQVKVEVKIENQQETLVNTQVKEEEQQVVA